jgi:adenylate kinase family enzyme
MLSEVRGTVPAAYIKSSFLKKPLTSDALVSMHDLISRGEMVSQDIVLHALICSMLQFPEAEGFLVDGFPRDVIQAREFENKV